MSRDNQSLPHLSPGTIGLDRSDTIMDQAAELAGLGYRYAFRTISLSETPSVGVLTTSEAQAILNAGMLIGLYQINRTTGLTAEQGTIDGRAAVANAAAVGAPPGLPLWYNFEGYTLAEVTADSLVSYLNSWAGAVVAGSYRAALYNGPQSVLTGDQLGSLPAFASYWKSGVEVSMPAPRGYQVIQLNPANYVPPGLRLNIDIDVTQQDNKAGLPVFWGEMASVNIGVSDDGDSQGEAVAGKLVTLPVGSMGVDKTGAMITKQAASQLVAEGYRFVLRSVGLSGNIGGSQAGQLSAGELSDLLECGMAMSVFQLNYLQSVITTDSGKKDGEYLSSYALDLGIKPYNTMPLWFDLEGFNGANRADLLDYLTGWIEAIVAAGFRPGIYVGKQFLLSSGDVEALYTGREFAFWQGGGWIPTVMPKCGYQMLQLWPLSVSVAGTKVNIDVVQQDFVKRNTAFYGPK